ncbi:MULTISPECIES: formyltetrahydrofolate deformylase [unclassified Amycolatopsis]|uniref:formyltetrahydrofolate deformylase n=1 Tax=unclassified Amycolatopsis TaxID=2618356 RepID=UPI001C69F578|nr:formyltetrahydrofolate deformylase [Amycolatopsis sp. DSM 110486]QYN26562.1 formyltetrahydrofolate deformylase [Amycolatopsis sp. DSM 110486]
MPSDAVLTLSCPDRPGIINAVTGFLLDRDANIVESSQFGDRTTGRFFMRAQFALPDELTRLDLSALDAEFAAVGAEFGMSWRFSSAADRQRVLIMVSKYGHCLNDLLFRAHTGALDVDVVGVVSNHPDLGPLARNHGVPFTHIPITSDTRQDAEEQLLDLVDALRVDLVVLARYMQILSEDLCKRLEGRAINIHHSMLPSFKGARPYHQAFDRGVKFVGATAHYVTSDLDEGPIIEQEVARVDHAMSAEQVTALGRDTECLALARAVHWHTSNRVLLNGQRTVVFR